MTPFQILVLLMLAYICYRLTVLGSTSFLKSLATYLIFGLENGLRHEIASAVGSYRSTAIINSGCTSNWWLH